LAIDLAEFEAGSAFDGDPAVELAALRQRLSVLQTLHIAHGCRTLIVVEGWDGAGKGAAVGSLAHCMDPRFARAFPIGPASQEESERHFLWRFWQKLPRSGEISILERSYYRRVLDDRINGSCAEADWQRAFDEINEFEAQQRDSGTRVIKLFLHITAEKQRAVLTAKLHDPARRWTVSAEQLHRFSLRDRHHEALGDVFAQTDTRWAPWRVIDANEAVAAEIALLRHVADELASYVPAQFPEGDAEAAALADLILG
jgi:AMP-polyphosphate phosphotransferase